MPEGDGDVLNQTSEKPQLATPILQQSTPTEQAPPTPIDKPHIPSLPLDASKGAPLAAEDYTVPPPLTERKMRVISRDRAEVVRAVPSASVRRRLRTEPNEGENLTASNRSRQSSERKLLPRKSGSFGGKKDTADVKLWDAKEPAEQDFAAMYGPYVAPEKGQTTPRGATKGGSDNGEATARGHPQEGAPVEDEAGASQNTHEKDESFHRNAGKSQKANSSAAEKVASHLAEEKKGPQSNGRVKKSKSSVSKHSKKASCAVI